MYDLFSISHSISILEDMCSDHSSNSRVNIYIFLVIDYCIQVEDGWITYLVDYYIQKFIF